ncbi:MAG: hypothetical protein ACE5QW_05535 [Thermoplasmata archaeon]
MARISGKITEGKPIFACFFACPERMISDFLTFLIDTGTGTALLSKTTAEKMGIDIANLPRSRKRTISAGGRPESRVLKSVIFILRTDENTSKEVLLSNIHAHRIMTRNKSDRNALLSMPNLLGRDFLQEGNFKFVLAYDRGETYLE